MANNKFVTVATIQERFNLTNYTPELNLEEAQVTIADVNRPALQLHGFYEHFEPSRIQVIGNVETAYLSKKSDEEKKESFAKLFSYEVPCVIFCRGEKPESVIVEEANKAKIPILGTDRGTSEFMSALIFSLNIFFKDEDFFIFSYIVSFSFKACEISCFVSDNMINLETK